MAINLKIVAISVVIGVLVIGGAGYFYFSQIRSKEAQKESITKATGSPTAKVEVIGRKEEGERKIPPSLAELQKRLEQARFYGQSAPEPEVPKLAQPGDGIEFKPGVPDGVVEKPSEIKVLPGEIVKPSVVSKPSLLAPNQYSSREEFKKEAEKYYTDSYIKSLSLTQDALVSGGFLKEGEKSPLKNEEDIRAYWKNYTKFLISQMDLSSLTPEQRDMILKAEISTFSVEQDFAGYKGDGSILPVASSIANSFNNRLEFAQDGNFTEEQLVKHFYPEFYLSQLLQSQEEMILNGFIKSEERVSLKTRKEVEWLMLKEVDYFKFKSKGAISEKESEAAKDGIVDSLSKIQQLEIGKLRQFFQSRASSENKKESGILANVDFLPHLGGLFGAFFRIWGLAIVNVAQAADVIGGGSQGAPEKIDICNTVDGTSIWTYYTPNLQLGIGAKTMVGGKPGPMVVETGKDCWRSIMYDADPYKADDWRACLYWGPPPVVPEIFKGKTNWGPNTIPPGQCIIPGPGYFFPTRCCSCLRIDVCVIPSPPFSTVLTVPWGCHVFCQLNLIWDKDKPNFCGCGL